MTAITTFKAIHRSSISIPMESPYATSYVNNGNLLPSVHHFRDMAHCWWIFCCRQERSLFNALVRSQPLNSGLQNLASRNLKKNIRYSSIVWCKEYFNNLNRLGVPHKCDRQTGTDRRTYFTMWTSPNSL